MKPIIYTVLLCLFLGINYRKGMAQAPKQEILISLADENKKPLTAASVELWEAGKESPLQAGLSDEKGICRFSIIKNGKYFVTAAAMGYAKTKSDAFEVPSNTTNIALTLKSTGTNLDAVTITGKKQLIERREGKTLINVDASPTNAGSNVLEVLEKSPGVMVDRNGGISLQGKTSVTILIDDKPTYLSGAELNNLLSSMSSGQVNQIELITSPSAKYDASGNGGIINIKTKKSRQEGFNGNINLNAGSGKYIKHNESVLLNYRRGKFNSFVNYIYSRNKGFTDIYALREYYNAQGNVISYLDQPSHLGSRNENNTIRTGIDFFVNENNTIGFTVAGAFIKRKGDGNATANWQNQYKQADSSIYTSSRSDNNLQNGSINLYSRHNLSKKQSLNFDLDFIRYKTANEQYFENERSGQISYIEASKGDIPTALKIYSAKLDYAWKATENSNFEAGLKSSSIHTDNTAAYSFFNGTGWTEDLRKSNHFIYQENIYSAYTNFNQKLKRFQYQVGLRFEATGYSGNQLGNALQPGSKFSRSYQNLFPSTYLQYDASENHSFSLNIGRRIDRPAYSKLNPFVFIINKFTYQKGNPFFLPQHNWNFELSHTYKQFFTTGLSFSRINNYFSQLFISEGSDILVYTEGNVGKMLNAGAYISLRVSPVKWWTLSAQTNFNYKYLSGYQGVDYRSSVKQFHNTLNNQFKINTGLTAELSGFYTTRARNDLQELLDPTGQLSAGLAKLLWKGNGTLRLTARDIFYTQSMKGVTDFPDASEVFSLWRDTRVVTFGFSYRFGKPLKAPKRSSGGASDEISRAGGA